MTRTMYDNNNDDVGYKHLFRVKEEQMDKKRLIKIN